MKIHLAKATIEDAREMHQMQIKSFKNLLNKYKDYDTNPENESIEKVLARINQETTDYYLIKMEDISIGAVRIHKLKNGLKCRIASVFILPEYQNKGIAQKVFKLAEERYKPENGWILDTILQEKGNCHLYEKMGYTKTGRTEKVNERMDIVYYEKKTNEK
jgi:GNAT superfamily N-acetyltransferase